MRTGDHGADCFGRACCELNEPPRTNSPQGDLQARWFRTASCTGTSWGFEKGPRRSLFRFFALFLLAEERAIPCFRRGGGEAFQADDTAGCQKAVGLLNRNALNMQLSLKCCEEHHCKQWYSRKSPWPFEKGPFCASAKPVFFIWRSYFLPRRKYAKTGKGLHPLDPRSLLRDTPE